VLTALTFVLTLEDPYRFEKSRAVGAYLGLVPGRDQSGDRDPQKHISKEGLEMLSVGSWSHALTTSLVPSERTRTSGVMERR
jgi:transposase